MFKKVLSFSLLCSALFDAPVGDTAAPEVLVRGFFSSCNSPINFRLGYEGDFVADGRLEQVEFSSGRVDCYEQFTNSGTATLNISGRMDIYGVFGASFSEAEWRFENNSTEIISRIKVETETDFLWAIGSRVILFEWCNTFLGAGGRYSVCDSTPKSFISDGVSQPAQGAQLNWREWQINLDLSYKIKYFTPYVGTKYSCARTHLSGFSAPISADGSGNNTFKNRLPVGFYLGCTISNGQYFMFNIEGRLVDEEAVTISGDFRF